MAGNYGQTNKVYIGNGDGTFSSGTAIGTEMDYRFAIGLGDVNGDGKLDVVAGNYGQTNRVYIGNGDGTFSSGTATGTDADLTYSIALGDVNGDGKMDLVEGNLVQTNKAYLANYEVSSPNTVSITVNAVNDLPQTSGPSSSATLNEDGSAQITVYGEDIDNPAVSDVSFAISSNVSHGTLVASVTLLESAGHYSKVYSYTPDGNFNGSDSFDFTFTTRSETSSSTDTTAAVSVPITVTPVNDAPVNSVPLVTQTIAETRDSASPTSLVFNSAHGNAITISDLDAYPVGGLTQVTMDATHGNLILAHTDNITVSGNETGHIVVTGGLDAINHALDGLTYRPDLKYNGTGSVKVESNDLGNSGVVGPLKDTDTISITINGINDAPVNTLPVAQSTDEDTPLVFSFANGNAIKVADVDAGDSPVRVQLRAAHGTLTLSGIAGLDFSAGVGDGIDDGSMTFTGSIENVNAALDGMVFTPTANHNGSASVKIITNDQGNTGSGNPKSDTDTLAITVNATPDNPVAKGFALVANEDAVKTVTGWAFTTVDGTGAQSIKLVSLPERGTLFIDTNGNNKLDSGEAVTLNQVISWADANCSEGKNIGSQDYNGLDSLKYVVIDTAASEGEHLA